MSSLSTYIQVYNAKGAIRDLLVKARSVDSVSDVLISHLSIEASTSEVFNVLPSNNKTILISEEEHEFEVTVTIGGNSVLMVLTDILVLPSIDSITIENTSSELSGLIQIIHA
jgi:hypothetical protein